MFNYSGNHKTDPLFDQIVTMAPNTCGPPLWAFLHFIFLAPTNFEVVPRFVEDLLNHFISSVEKCPDCEFWTSVLSETFIRNFFAPINISFVKLDMYVETCAILHVKALLFVLDFDEKWESMKKSSKATALSSRKIVSALFVFISK